MEFQHNNYLLSDRAQFFGRKTVPIRLSRQLLLLPSSIKNNYVQIVTIILAQLNDKPYNGKRQNMYYQKLGSVF